MDDFQRFGHVYYQGEGVQLLFCAHSPKWGRSVVTRWHEFDDRDPDLLKKMGTCVNTALAQGRTERPRKVLELGINYMHDKWAVFWLLEATEAQQDAVTSELQTGIYSEAPSELTLGAPFYGAETGKRLYRANPPKWEGDVVVKAQDFFVESKLELEEASACLSSALAQVQMEHRHVCRLYEVSFTLDGHILTINHVIEALEKDLADAIRERQSLDLFSFLEETVSALSYAHAKRIAHRDIKPQNIFLDRSGHFKVGDFDCAFSQGASFRSSREAGTTAYNSPEQRFINSGRYVDRIDPFKCDVYSLGITAISLASQTLLYEPLSAEELPFAVLTEASAEEAEELPPCIQRLTCQLGLKKLLRKMTDPRADARSTFSQIDLELSSCSRLDPPQSEEVKCPEVATAQGTPATQPLVHLTETAIRRFNFSSREWEEHRLQTQILVNKGSRWVCLDEFRVCCCGGKSYEGSPAMKCAAIVRRDLSVVKISDMVSGRSIHGVVAVANQSAVYVFGGSKGYCTRYAGDPIKKCEKLVRESAWQPLPDMQKPKAFFNPCLWENIVYVCGDTTEREASIELFDLSRECFTPAQVSFPQDGACCLFVESDQLAVLSKRYLRRYARNANGQLSLSKEVQVANVKKTTNSQPVLEQGTGLCCWVDEGGKCLRFSCERGKLVDEIH